MPKFKLIYKQALKLALLMSLCFFSIFILQTISLTKDKPLDYAEMAVQPTQSNSQMIRGISLEDVQYIPAETASDPVLEQAIRNLGFHSYPSSPGARPDSYYYNRIALNGDDLLETLVYLVGQSFCGTGGCSLIILQRVEDEYQLLGKLPVTREPVIVTNEKKWSESDGILFH